VDGLAKLLLVVNLHGAINSPAPVRKALGDLKVVRKFSASVVTDDPATGGMLRLCKDYIAWSPVGPDLLSELLEKRGMVSTNRTLDPASLKSMGYKSYDDMAKKMTEGGLRLSAVQGVRPFFRLAPPAGGFKRSLRRQFTEKGLLGSNPGLEAIVRRMV
jgi:large subunit ribosomal protein L30